MPAVVYELQFLQLFLHFLPLFALFLAHIRFTLSDETPDGFCESSRIVRVDKGIFSDEGNTSLFIWRIAIGTSRNWI